MITYLACEEGTRALIVPNREPTEGEWCQITDSNNPKFIKYCQYVAPKEPIEEKVIKITVEPTSKVCPIGEQIGYDITFSEPITVPFVVPISVTDRNGKHVTNLGITVTAGKATGFMSFDRAGDYTVTNESINFHRTIIDARLEMVEQPWIRVYQ